MKTGALIAASLNPVGGNRDNEEMPVFLPMQHLDGTTVIKREIFMMRKAGITPIIVLCGYQKEVLKNHLSHNGVIFCEDAEFACHDLQKTLEAGLEFARGFCDRVVVAPVEYPAFLAGTLEKLLRCGKTTAPVYRGREGWPRLQVFSGQRDFREEKIFSEKPGRTCERIEVDDAGILYSVNEEEGMAKAREYTRRQREANVLQMKLKVMLTKEEVFFGPGVYSLLCNIDETGSIQAAAEKMGMSYSKSWKMINRAEAQMGFKFVDRVYGGKNGGSSTLTEEARMFLDRYKALTEDIKRISQNYFDIYFRDFQ